MCLPNFLLSLLLPLLSSTPLGLLIVLLLPPSITAQQQQQPDAACNLPGFTFKQRQQPAAGSGPLELHTTPYTGRNARTPPRPFSTVTATAAACLANDECVMFTSDGYTIAAHSRYYVTKPTAAQAADDPGLSWRPMHYCAPGTSACCGTWVAKALLVQLDDDKQQEQDALAPVSIDTEPLDADRGMEVYLSRDLLQTVCAGKPPQLLPGSKRLKPAGSGVGTSSCPQRCVAACCKQLQLGQPFSGEGDAKLVMGRYYFSQCSATTCRGCDFEAWARAAAPAGNMLLRQYLRDKSLEQPTSSKAGARGGAAQPSG